MSTLVWSVISILCFIPAIVLHEVAHGWMAAKLGDPTAKQSGRLTLNPLKHVYPFGTVILPLILAVSHMPVFGYAKPVPYDPRYFKDIRKGELLTGLAGPAANLLLSLVGAGIAWLGAWLFGLSYDWAYWVYVVGFFFVMVNLCLMFFNLIPIPPLDGSSIIGFFLPLSALPTYYKIQRYALPVFFLIVIGLPYIGIDPIGWYIQHTAVALTYLMVP